MISLNDAINKVLEVRKGEKIAVCLECTEFYAFKTVDSRLKNFTQGTIMGLTFIVFKETGELKGMDSLMAWAKYLGPIRERIKPVNVAPFLPKGTDDTAIQWWKLQNK